MSKQPKPNRISKPINITLRPEIRKTLDAIVLEDDTTKSEVIARLLLKEKSRRTLKSA